MSRIIKFEYHLLNNKDEFKKELNVVQSCSIVYKSLAQIKRKASITISEDNDINYLSDRIQPFVVIDGVKHSMGIFLLNSSVRMINSISTTRDIECYDKTQILTDDKISDRYYIAKNSNVVLEAEKILNAIGLTSNITASTQQLQRDLEFNVGASKLEIINALLGAINYFSIRVDAEGVFISSPYVLPSEQQLDFTYITDQNSVILDEVEEELDLFDIPNRFIAVLSNPEQQPLVATYTNDNPQSPLSTVSRGRTITAEIKEVENITDQATLSNYIQRIAFNACQVYGKVKFRTWIIPEHEYLNTLRFKYFDEIDAVFQETAWSMKLCAGVVMEHEVRRVINV